MHTSQNAEKAKDAAIALAAVTSEVKNQALAEISRLLERDRDKIIAANQADLERSEREGAP